jgi:hypothetical protein
MVNRIRFTLTLHKFLDAVAFRVVFSGSRADFSKPCIATLGNCSCIALPPASMQSYVRFRKIENGPENADIKAAQRFCAENLCNVRVYVPWIPAKNMPE